MAPNSCEHDMVARFVWNKAEEMLHNLIRILAIINILDLNAAVLNNFWLYCLSFFEHKYVAKAGSF